MTASRRAVAGGRSNAERSREYSRAVSAELRDIGPIPPVVDHERREHCRLDLRAFCETYFAHKFPLPWSDDHLLVIEHVQRVILNGGWQSIAMPRGSGKTTICNVAVEWASLYGHHRYVVFVGPNRDKAHKSLEAIKTDIETNDLLFDDFPGVCFPIRALEGESRRCRGQTQCGRRTRVEWGEKIVLPDIFGEPTAGVVTEAYGIDAAIRGAFHTTPDGRQIRPTVGILDDLQTDESAKSPTQVANRLHTVGTTVANLGGPGESIGLILPCTVMSPGDVADTLLDRERCPEWNGIRCKALESPPDRGDLWDEYDRLRRESLRVHQDLRLATRFYLEHRAEMDRGAKVSWEHRYDRAKPGLPAAAGEVSALQHAMNLKLTNPVGFACDMQNEPSEAARQASDMLTAPAIMGRLNGFPRGTVPDDRDVLVGMVDVQQNSLWWAVLAFRSRDFAGDVVDYGVWPDQKRRYVTLRDIRPTLQQATGVTGVAGAALAGLRTLIATEIARPWPTADGGIMHPRVVGVDAQWHKVTGAVYRLARDLGALVLPCHADAIGPSRNPMGRWPQKRGEKVGLEWVSRPKYGERRARNMTWDNNFWKSFVHDRLCVPDAEAGRLRLFGDEPELHRLVADHLTAEYPVRVAGQGRELDEWKPRVGRPDNHLGDCVVGCCVLASALGAAAPGVQTVQEKKPAAPRPKVSARELQRRAREAKR